jgi:uncharacterized protein YxjI
VIGPISFPLHYPVTATFSVLTIGQTVRITDALGQQLLYVKQQAFRLKTDIAVYSDDSQVQTMYRIRGDRMLGSVRYSVSSADGRLIGTLGRNWADAFWRATYHILDANDVEIGTIQQENPWIRLLHGLAEQIPILGLFAGIYINPTYRVDVPPGTTVMRLVKKASFTARSFVIESVVPLRRETEQIVVPAVITFALMERARA